MNDKLKPNQEKKVIENFIECIMDDLDYYHFDELIIEKYKKELFQFFTKISKEHSLFSPRFDFSNKKNIVNDKEKVLRILELLEKILGNLEKYDRSRSMQTWKHERIITEIKKILES